MTDDKYNALLKCSPPASLVHPPMSNSDRAAQFAPFAALSGFEGAVIETARVTEFEKELDEYEIERINRRLLSLSLGDTVVKITFFCPDRRKKGGNYLSVTDTVNSLDPIGQKLVTGTGITILFCNILAIEDGEL